MLDAPGISDSDEEEVIDYYFAMVQQDELAERLRDCFSKFELERLIEELRRIDAL